MTASIYAFKKGKTETYRKNEGIIFTLNGQTHGHLTPDFFRRKSVGLSYLTDSILVMVDCSKFAGRAREDLFMNSRDRLSGGELRQELEEALEEMLKHHQGLRESRRSGDGRRRRRSSRIASRWRTSLNRFSRGHKRSPTCSYKASEHRIPSSPRMSKVRTNPIRERLIQPSSGSGERLTDRSCNAKPPGISVRE